MNPDTALFHALNDFVGTFPPLDWVVRVLVNDFTVPTLVALVAVWLWYAGENPEERQKNQRAVVIIALAVLVANAVIKDLSFIYFRPRPFATETVKLLFYRPSVSSFPSVPIALAFCFAAGAWYANRRIGIALVVLASLYGLARVYAGVHYPSDIVGGALIGWGAVYGLKRLDQFVLPLADGTIRLARRLSLA
jgi:undecaprenyl-diphosphatase